MRGRYRNQQLLASAVLRHCQLCRFPHTGTAVSAHSNQSRHGKAMAKKAHDVFIAYLCNSCHHLIDQGSGLSQDERNAAWHLAHERSVPMFLHFIEDEQGIDLLLEKIDDYDEQTQSLIRQRADEVRGDEQDRG